MTKIKEGRPKKNDGMFVKYKMVYKIIPDNGEPIRFITLAEKLKPMSRSTISKVLEYGVFTGLLIKQQKSKKNITYSKRTEKTVQSLDDIEQQIKKLDSYGCDGFQKGVYLLSNIPRPYDRHLLLKIKKEQDIEGLNYSQAIFLNFSLSFIEKHIQKALWNYATKTNTEEAKEGFRVAVQSIIVPLISELTDYIDGIGLSDNVTQALYLCNRRTLQTSDFADYKK